MKYDAIIFDFDGTLVRSHQPVYEVIERLTRRRRRGTPMPTPEEFREIGMRALLERLNVRPWQIPWFTFRARQALTARFGTVDFEPGLPDVLRAARSRGQRLAIVSSNSKRNVEGVLARHDARDLFEVCSFGASLFGKRRNLRRVIDQLGLAPERILTVGDEARDIEAARAVGLDVAAVGWGFHAPERLANFAPTHVVRTTGELARVLVGE